MQRIIAALLIAVLGLFAAGCEMPEETGSNSAGDSKGGKKAKPVKPMKVEATKILKEFEENEAAADGKYKGKTLQVSGVVNKVDTEMWDDEQYVVNVGGGGEYEFTSVNCNDQESKDVAKIKKGQNIVVVGEFDDGGDLGVELKNCKIQ